VFYTGRFFTLKDHSSCFLAFKGFSQIYADLSQIFTDSPSLPLREGEQGGEFF
jgi:hypothetical protein